jgi:hypothetical protein
MRMRRSIRAAVVTATAALGLLAGSVVPAHAATGWDRCPKGRFCLFDGDSGTGAMAVYSASQSSLGAWDNKANSAYNRTGDPYVCMYSLANYQYVDPVHDVVDCGEGSGDDTYDLADSVDPDISLANKLSSFRFSRLARVAAGDPEYIRWDAPNGGARRPSVLPFGDLDEDGYGDLLNRTWNGHLWFVRGDGSGAYVGSGWNQMTALTRHGDFSGDGHEDLLARDGSGRLWIYPGNGKGWFGGRKLIGTGWNQMTALQAAGDMNSDGHDDLLARDSTGRLWIYPGDGHGRYGARKLIGTGWNQMRAFAAPGDLNGDKRNDLVVSDGTGKLWLYPGDGHGRYGTRKMIGPGGWGMFPTVLGVGDVSGDGRPDLMAAEQDAGPYAEVRLYEGVSGGTIRNAGREGDTDQGDRIF